MEKINVQRLANSKKCIVNFNGETFITKNCTPEEIIAKIEKKCSCKCGVEKLKL